ncbi:MAG: hypothetical protein ACREJQ_04465, partial [bacterium]
KGGSLPGIATSAIYAKPKDGKARAIALFFENLPLAVWLHFMQSYVHQEFERSLMTDDAFFEVVRKRLMEPPAAN